MRSIEIIYSIPQLIYYSNAAPVLPAGVDWTAGAASRLNEPHKEESMGKLKKLIWLALALVSAVMAAPAAAADWNPTGQVRILVPLAAGGATDVLARVLADKMRTPLGQPVIVENRPGANMQVAIDAMAAAPADGRTMLMGHSGLTVTPATQKMRYDAIKDFAPLSLVSSIVHVLVASKNLPVNNVRELIAYAKANPGKLNYGSLGGPGSVTHLEVELMSMLSGGFSMVRIDYNSTPQQITDLTAGRMDLMFNALGTLRPFIDSGAIKGLAVTSGQRSVLTPTLPTMIEAGVPGFEPTFWLGLLAKPGTAPEVGERVNDVIAQLIKDPDVQKQFVLQGMDGLAWGPKRFADFIKADLDLWARTVKTANIKVE